MATVSTSTTAPYETLPAVRMHWTSDSARLLCRLLDDGWVIGSPLGSELVMPLSDARGVTLLLYGRDGDTFVIPTCPRAVNALGRLVRDGTVISFSLDHADEFRAEVPRLVGAKAA